MRWRNRKWLAWSLQQSVPTSGAGTPHPGLSRSDSETIASWVEAARERSPVLFVGAGWTRNADPAPRPYDIPADGRPLPLLWGELVKQFSDELSHDLGEDPNRDALWLAELYRQRFGEDALLRVLRRAVPNDRLRPGPLHEALRSVTTWRAILTTNYDTLLEKTFEPHQRVATCVDDIDLVRSAAVGAVELIHLHGVIDRPKTIVLALEDYRRYPATHPGLLAKVRQLFLQHPVLFVGFGVTDPNFMQWSGWVSDVVGDGKNPWINLTLDSPPSLSHGRYWGKRLDFISVQGFPRFKAVVPEILRVVGEALEDEGRSREVARLRIRACVSPDEVVREVRELLELGQRGGAEGDDWKYFCRWLFNTAASRVLDLASAPWLERPASDPKDEETRGLRIIVDARPVRMRDRDKELIRTLRDTFGRQAWIDWLAVLRPLFPEGVWIFERVDLTEKRPSDIWNRTPVPLDEEAGADASGAPAAPAAGGAPPRAPGTPGAATPPVPEGSASSGPPSGTVKSVLEDDATMTVLDRLRSGAPIAIPSAPKTAQEHRVAGYLAAQRGEWRAAADAYAQAVTASRAEYEPVRREWLTLRSQAACLDRAVFEVSLEGREAVRSELAEVIERLRAMRTTLGQLPADARIDPLLEDEIDAERKLAAELIDDLDRHGADRSVRLGDKYGSAEQWLDRVEGIFVAPSIARPAAEALGTLQWRFGDLAQSALTLARYGSERLATVVRATARDVECDPRGIAAFIGESLREPRWSGECLSRLEALVEVLPWCTAQDLLRLGSLITSARRALRDHPRGAVRGGSIEFSWSARARAEEAESSRWKWLAATDAVTAVESWSREIHDVDSISLQKSRAFAELDRLPWASWLATGAITSADAERIAVALADVRIQAPRASGHYEDVEAVLSFLLDLLERRVVTAAPASPMRDRIDKLVALIPEPRRAVFVASVANIDHDRQRLSAVVGEALRNLDLSKPEAARAALDAIAAAAECPPEGLEKVAQVLAAVTESVAKDLAQGAQGPFDTFRADRSFERARTVGFVLSRLLTSETVPQKRLLIERAAAILNVMNIAAEYLTTAPQVLGDVQPTVESAITQLLCGAGPTSVSRRSQMYAGLRGVVRALVQVGVGAVTNDWLTSTCLAARSADADLAEYASWIISEWAARREGGHANEMARLVVAPTLRAAASDARIGTRANGLRGLVAIQRTSPSDQDAAILASHIGDTRVAIVKALLGYTPVP